MYNVLSSKLLHFPQVERDWKVPPRLKSTFWIRMTTGLNLPRRSLLALSQNSLFQVRYAFQINILHKRRKHCHINAMDNYIITLISTEPCMFFFLLLKFCYCRLFYSIFHIACLKYMQASIKFMQHVFFFFFGVECTVFLVVSKQRYNCVS